MNPPIVRLIAALLLAPALAGQAGAAETAADAYRIAAGDKIRVLVYGHEDLSGEFDVDNGGGISLPLIRRVPAAGRTTVELAAQIRERLRPDYLRDPKVSVEVIAYRPVFVLGEVRNPGSYPWSTGMTVVKAVALAGGYTYRADKNDVVVTRDDDRLPAREQARLLPGDVVEIPERFF